MVKKEKRIDDYTINLALKNVLDKISSLDALIFYLRLSKNLTLQEISDKLAISHECVRKHLQKIVAIAKKSAKKI